MATLISVVAVYVVTDGLKGSSGAEDNYPTHTYIGPIFCFSLVIGIALE